ncbi:ABC transporter permease [Euzebya tangerina]|uniref:ABC transporter permease n=1 Tax=Euzebya tangerina TaxID=591198 RepID=UPI0013C2DC07|nr:ABC transporter permease [Euzebya tangerina]
MSTTQQLLSTDAIEQRHRTGVIAALADGWTIGKRNLKHFTRLPRLLVFSTIQPVMFVLLFGYIFDGAVSGSLPDGFPNYLSFVLPGIFIQSTVFRMTTTAVGLAEDLEKGVIDRFRSLPMSRAGVLIGRTIADLVRAAAVILLMTVFGVAVGFRFTSILGAIGSVLIVALLGYGLSWVFVFVALNVPGAESAQSAAFVAAFPLSFVSSVFVPPESIPVEWLAFIARNSPITAAADAARGLAVTGPVAQPVLLTVIWTIGILALFIPLSVYQFRKLE